jgi:hypothetical protein
LAQPLPEQIDWYRRRDGPGLGHRCGWNVALVWQISRMAGVSTRGIVPETPCENEMIEGTGSR